MNFWVSWRNTKQRAQDERFAELRQQLAQAKSVEDVEAVVVTIPGLRSKLVISPTHVREMMTAAEQRIEAIWEAQGRA
jgi:steroid 5-alpha reductase family enzyme